MARPIKAAFGGKIHGTMKAKGGLIDGKENHPGMDTEEDDTVEALLSPGEIVVPRTKADDPRLAAEFAAKEALKKDGKKKKDGVPGMLDILYLQGTPSSKKKK